MSARRGVLFDVDGTLVDSSYIHTLCWWQAFRQHDTDVPMATIHRAIGMGTDKLVAQVSPDSADQADELAASHDALYASYWPGLRLLPGARELLKRCHDAGLITVLASSAGEREIQVLLAVLDADASIDHVTHADDADASKPEPDIVSVALDKAGLSADEAIFVGDAIWDVQACAAIQLGCIGLESGGTSAAELRAAGAVAVYRDPAELLLHSEEHLS
jgi:HAD superfamily hydrolase (TIGR01509 family)